MLPDGTTGSGGTAEKNVELFIYYYFLEKLSGGKVLPEPWPLQRRWSSPASSHILPSSGRR